MVERRPHVLFLMSDEHRADVAGFAGNGVVRTPVLDRLAESGAVFTNAYTPAPICIPARQSLMAGQWPRTTGCERFGEDLPPGHPTFAGALAAQGYETVASGKLHHLGPDQMQGWTRRLSGDMTVDPRYRRRAAGASAPLRPSRAKWSQVKEIQRAGVGRAPYETADNFAVAQAIAYLTEHFVDPYYDRAVPDAPLLLKVSLNQPHYPYLTARADAFVHYLRRVPVYTDQELFDHPFLGAGSVVRIGPEVSEVELRRATAAYYAMIESVDAAFGAVLAAIEHVGEDLDDWIVIYTSDHGELLGEHGVVEKQKFFEGSVRVPLIIRWPGRFAPRRVDRNVNLCDLFATLCQLTGADQPSGLDSRSLVPLLDGSTDHWDNETVSQFGGVNLMIKRDALKYQYYGEGQPEVLFDLNADPGELRNAIAEPRHASAVAAFRARRDELGFPRREAS